jgi:hypothetical protein
MAQIFIVEIWCHNALFSMSGASNRKTHTQKNTNKITTSTIGQWPE